ncbi:MAG: flagellar hook protein FlgE [Sulfuritalea sp.]|nr:flagellar hook protein FlgE [Sulfuritalea sp.]
MAFAASLSGLNGASTAIDIIGNNISNLQTVGFKTSKARFADVLAASLPGAPSAELASAGVSVAVARRNEQGGVAQSDNPLDMAISGMGFFRLNKGGEITYSRDGRFQLAYDASSPDTRVLVNPTGRNVTGYPATYATDPQGVIVTAGAPQDISIDLVMPASATSQVSLGVSLDARSAPPLTAPFDPANPLSYNSATGLTVYDDAGAAHDLRMYFAKPGAGNVWDLHTTLDGGSQTGPVNVGFGTDGLLATTMPLAAQTYALGSGGSLSVALDFTGSVQYGQTFHVDSMTQDGWREGTIDSSSGFSVGNDGVIVGYYTNGQSRKVAQIVLANFINPDAMIGLGDSQWRANEDPVRGSGEEILDVPGGRLGGNGLGSIQGWATEQSNVDLNAELVALIEQQRNYQASAQTFKILDEVMQNLANMGR